MRRCPLFVTDMGGVPDQPRRPRLRAAIDGEAGGESSWFCLESDGRRVFTPPAPLAHRHFTSSRRCGIRCPMRVLLKSLSAVAFFGFVSTSACLRAEEASETPWTEVLGPSLGMVPELASESLFWRKPVVWREDFGDALEEAESRNMPLFVTWRCLPCKQCAEFDQEVLDGSPQLTPLLRRFVTVRMTDAAELDERYFPYRGYQDLDLSWWGYFLSPQGQLYGVFGGKDHVSEATRISEPALVNSLRRVLRHHQ